MYAVSAQFLKAIRRPHRPEVRIEVWQGGVNVTPTIYGRGGLPITGGSVSIDSGSQVRRTLSLTVADPALSPTTAQDLLAPYGTELRVQRGIKYPNGSIEYANAGWFRIDTDSITISGQAGATEVSLTGSDRASWIVDARFWKVTQSGKGLTVVQQIAALAAAGLPSHVPPMVDLTGNTKVITTPVVWDDKDRMGAITNLATGIGAEFFIDADGTPTLRNVPTPDKTKVNWNMDTGDGGSLVSVTPAVDRTNVYNSVTAICVTADGTAGIQATVVDTDPNSATFYGGKFGKKVRFYSSPILAGINAANTLANCSNAATNLLNKYKGSGWTVAGETIVNPALADGDVIQVNLPDGRVQYHVVDTTNIPLDNATTQSTTTRSNDPQGDIDATQQ